MVLIYALELIIEWKLKKKLRVVVACNQLKNCKKNESYQ